MNSILKLVFLVSIFFLISCDVIAEISPYSKETVYIKLRFDFKHKNQEESLEWLIKCDKYTRKSGVNPDYAREKKFAKWDVKNIEGVLKSGAGVKLSFLDVRWASKVCLKDAFVLDWDAELIRRLKIGIDFFDNMKEPSLCFTLSITI